MYEKQQRILRWQVPVDDEWHMLEYAGEVVHVGTRDPSVVELWTLADEITGDTTPSYHVFRVFGTGQPIVGRAKHVGSVIATPQLVWHLFEAELINNAGYDVEGQIVLREKS